MYMPHIVLWLSAGSDSRVNVPNVIQPKQKYMYSLNVLVEEDLPRISKLNCWIHQSGYKGVTTYFNVFFTHFKCLYS